MIVSNQKTVNRIKIIFLVLIVVSCGSESEKQTSGPLTKTETKTASSGHIMVGDKINLSDYALNPNNGKTIENDKLILLNFLAICCGPCIASFPHLEEVQEKYNNYLQILAISDENDKKIEPFLEKKTFDLAFFNNEDKALFKTFSIMGSLS